MLQKLFGARALLAVIGGLAASVAGLEGHFRADYQMPKKKKGRARIGAGTYGKSLRAHFDGKGINWSAKPNKIKQAARKF